MRLRWSIPAAAAAVVLSACMSPSDAGEHQRVVGTILADTTMLIIRTIVAPDTVPLGVPVTIDVNSFGSSSCTIPDGVDLAEAPGLMRVIPYDRVPMRPVACTADFAARPHPVEMVFTVPGPATIRAVGRVWDTALDSIEHTVYVMP